MKRFLVRAVLVLAVLALIAAIAAGIYVYPHYSKYQTRADSFDLAEISSIPAISEVFDRTGRRYGRLQGETRYVVPLSEVSPLFIDALLAREDSRFHEHKGVDYRGIARAAVRNVKAGRVEQGASTITQQLARNSFELAENDWERKVIEALLALRMERELTKDEILEAYVNRIYYGRGLYGVETAARACFGKSAKDLDLSESAILAGLIRSPNRFTPLEDTANALAQRDQVLARMEEIGMVTTAEADAARARQMPATKRLPPPVQEDYAMDAVKRDLEIVLTPQQLDQGGLRIYTTIDHRLQLVGQAAVDARLTEIESTPDWPHPTRANLRSRLRQSRLPAGRPRRDRKFHRRHPGADRRSRFRRESLQPRHPGQASDGVHVQALRLRGRVRSRSSSRHVRRRRIDPPRRDPIRGDDLGTEKFRRRQRRPASGLDGPRSFAEYHDRSRR